MIYRSKFLKKHLCFRKHIIHIAICHILKQQTFYFGQKTSSISKKISVYKIQIFKFRFLCKIEEIATVISEKKVPCRTQLTLFKRSQDAPYKARHHFRVRLLGTFHRYFLSNSPFRNLKELASLYYFLLQAENHE